MAEEPRITRREPDDDARSDDSYEKVEDSHAKEGSSKQDGEHKCEDGQCLREEVAALKSQLAHILQIIGNIAANEEMAELRKQLEAMRVKPVAEPTPEVVRGLEEQVSSLKSQLTVKETNELHSQAEIASLKSQLALKEQKERLSEQENALLKSRLALKEAKEAELKAEIGRRDDKMETIQAVLNMAKSSIKRPLPYDKPTLPFAPFVPDPLFPAKHLLKDFDRSAPKYDFLSLPDVPDETNWKLWHSEVNLEERRHMIGSMTVAIFPALTATVYLNDPRLKDVVQYTGKLEKGMFENSSEKAEYFALVLEKINKIAAELQASKAKRLREASNDQPESGYWNSPTAKD